VCHISKDGIKECQKFHELCHNLKIKLKPEKCITSSKIVTWIGITFNFEKKIIFPSEKRINSIKMLINNLLIKSFCTLAEIQKLLGKISSFHHMNKIKALIYNLRALDSNIFENQDIKLTESHIIEMKIILKCLDFIESGIVTFKSMKFLVENEQNLINLSLNSDKKVVLASELLNKMNKRICLENITVIICDSSLTKSAGLIFNTKQNYKFEFDHKDLGQQTIDKYESIVILIGAILSLNYNLPCEGYLIFTDNEVSRYVLNMSNAKNNILKKLSCQLCLLMNKLNKWYTIHRVTTTENYLADALSRSIKIDNCLDLEFEEIPSFKVNEIVEKIVINITKKSYQQFLEEMLKNC